MKKMNIKFHATVILLFCLCGCCYGYFFQTKKSQKKKTPTESTLNHTVLVTTAFWNVESKLGNKTNGLQHYSSRFRTFMNLKANLAIYGDSSSLTHILNTRKHHSPASVIRLVIESKYHDFEPCKSHWLELLKTPGNYSDATHVPTIDLGCIWLAKLWLLQNSAKELSQYEWHLWLDIGLHLQTGHHINHARFPNEEKLMNLPKDKLIVSESGHINCSYDNSSNYHLGIFEYGHCIAGTSFLIHRDGLKAVLPAFQKTFELCLKFFATSAAAHHNISNNAFPCMSDQVIMSHIDPELVHRIGTIGYGAIAYDLLC